MICVAIVNLIRYGSCSHAHPHPQDSRKSDKEKSSDIPSWATGQKRNDGENCTNYANRLCNDKYPDSYPKGPGSEHSKIKKNCERK